MTRAAPPFKQRDATRAAKAAMAAGLSVDEIVVEPDGRIRVVTSQGRDKVSAETKNTWDGVL